MLRVEEVGGCCILAETVASRGARLGRSRALPSCGGEWTETLNFPPLIWAPSYLTSRLGGRGARGDWGFSGHILSIPRGG